MAKEKMDISKVLAILAQPREKPVPLTNVDRLRLEIPYITKERTKDMRTVRVVMPLDAIRPMPLIFIPHYEMGEDSIELRDYLVKGWAVACPAEFNDKYNGTLTDDDLVFNNAALYTLRHRPEFDKSRIVLVGGSAGGYMTLMLTGLHLGICASIANGPVTNVLFNFHYYFSKANSLNMQVLMKLSAEKIEKKEPQNKKEQEGKNLMEMLQELSVLPIPFLAGLAGIFAPIGNNFPDKTDVARWEALSAVGIADRFSSPIMVNHCTSDVLVPVDQISKRFTYERPGESLPAEFDMRIPQDFPGKLKYSLEECLPQDQTRTARIVVPEIADAEEPIPYDIGKMFNINVYDDGPAEGYGTHSARMDVGRRLDIPYLEEMISRTSAKNCLLTPAMLKALLRRYRGEEIALPAHEKVDDTVYGSLAIYRQEVRDELAEWVENQGRDALEQVFEEMMKSEPNDRLRQVMCEVLTK